MNTLNNLRDKKSLKIVTRRLVDMEAEAALNYQEYKQGVSWYFHQETTTSILQEFPDTFNSTPYILVDAYETALLFEKLKLSYNEIDTWSLGTSIIPITVLNKLGELDMEKILSYTDTLEEFTQLQKWLRKGIENPIGSDIHMEYCEEASYLDVDPEAYHSMLDRLFLNMLNNFAAYGDNEWDPSRGELNSLMIQRFHIGFLKEEMGTIPEWDMPDIWHRLKLVEGINPRFFLGEYSNTF